MARNPEMIKRGIDQLQNLDRLRARLRDDPQSVFNPILKRTPRRAGFESLGEPDESELPAAAIIDTDRIAQAAARAIEKIQADGTAADLTPSETAGFEAIVQLEGRPAILIQDGSFFPPPADWQHLETSRADIERVFRSIGRIEVTGHPGGLSWIGTGVLVGDGVLMTNRHVAKEFCRWDQRGTWRFEPFMTAQVDYCEELGATTPCEFTLDDVIGVHDTLDIALLRVSANSPSGATPPAPLPVSTHGVPSPGAEVYVVGYPASDSRRNDPDVMRRIFANVYDVKRLQPGTAVRLDAGPAVFEHDCSTLGGNSGSAVIDLGSHQIVGLHFMGRYREYNRAVALWQLQADPLLRNNGVAFV